MGLDVYLVNGNRDDDSDFHSEKYPDHLFKKNYLRSSYNASGYNSVMRNVVGHDLYYIFDVKDGDGYEIPLSKERLVGCLMRAEEILQTLKTTNILLNVITIDAINFLSGESKEVTAQDAIRITKEAIAKHNGIGSYGNRDGDFYLDKPIEVTSFIPGSRYGRPCVHCVYRDDLEWYIQATEIVVEFIHYAMTLDNPILHWSA